MNKQKAIKRKIIQLRLKEKHNKLPPLSASVSPQKINEVPLFLRLEQEYKKNFELPEMKEKQQKLNEIKKNRSIRIKVRGIIPFSMN